MEEMQTTEQYVQANTDTNTSEVTIVDNTTNYPVEKPNPLDVLMNALSDLLLENEDFNYNTARYAAERVIDDFDIDEHLDMDDLTEKVSERVSDDFDIDDHIDIDDLAEKVSESMSISDLTESVIDEIDMRDLADNVLERIDYSDFASDISDYIDFEYEIAKHLDIEDKAYSLLSDYDPTNSCSLGNQFTLAVAKAMYHILQNIELQEYKDVQALVKIHSIAAELGQETGNNPVEESSPNVSQVTYASMQTYSNTHGVDPSSESVESSNTDSQLTDSENFVPSEVPEKSVKDHTIEALKRVVHEVLASYVPGYDSDPYMKIRLEAKAFDTFTYWMEGKW